MSQLRTEVMEVDAGAREWYLVSAAGVPLGRLASRVALVLRGKHKATYAPQADNGDFVVVTEAAQVVLTGAKWHDKKYYRHSGYPGGLREETAEHLRQRMPEEIIRRAVKGMLPKNALGRRMGKKLKVYAGGEHPHAAQQPKPLEL